MQRMLHIELKKTTKTLKVFSHAWLPDSEYLKKKIAVVFAMVFGED